MLFANLRRTLIAGAALLLVTSGAATAQVECGDAKKITRFGNTATRFSSPVTSVEGLQAMVANNRQDVEALLRQSGFQGNPDDFFRAVASGEGISPFAIEPGTRFGWVFYREKGEPTLERNLCWAGKTAIAGWEIQFVSDGTWYSIVAPEVCGNLSLVAQQAEPVCKVTLRDTAGDTCAEKDLIVDASGSTGNLTVELVSPSGARRALSASESTGPNRWRVSADETQGTFRAVLTSTETNLRGGTLQCQAEASVERDCCVGGPPSIRVTADPDTVEPFQETVVTADPSVNECTEIDRVTLDGQGVTSPYQVTKSYNEPGSYSVSGTVVDGRGQSAEDSATITVTECQTRDCRKQMRALNGSDSQWILRGWVGKLDMDEEVRFDYAGGFEREAFRLDSGSSLGAQVEWLANDRFGLGFGAILAQAEVHYEYDLPTLWEMDDDETDILTLFAGPVFHLIPSSRVDLFISPFLAYADVGDVSFVTPNGPTRGLDFDSEFSWGAQLGLDLPFGSEARWGLHGGLIYQDLDMESEAPEFSFDANPLHGNLGLFYRF